MERYPLSWPAGWPRFEPAQRRRARFAKGVVRSNGESRWTNYDAVSVHEGASRVLEALRKLGVSDGDSIISTNVRTRLDGLPRSDGPAPSDPGAAVYWTREGDPAMRCMAIDLYDRVADNLAAIAATLEAMRLIERHGGARVLDRAFAGFEALPGPGGPSRWRTVLGMPETVAGTLEEARAAYRRLAAAHHPDRPGGSTERMQEINRAWQEAQDALVGTE